jgi:hypothetical protein
MTTKMATVVENPLLKGYKFHVNQTKDGETLYFFPDIDILVISGEWQCIQGKAAKFIYEKLSVNTEKKCLAYKNKDIIVKLHLLIDRATDAAIQSYADYELLLDSLS